jgi:hypothetical protein
VLVNKTLLQLVMSLAINRWARLGIERAAEESLRHQKRLHFAASDVDFNDLVHGVVGCLASKQTTAGIEHIGDAASGRSIAPWSAWEAT